MESNNKTSKLKIIIYIIIMFVVATSFVYFFFGNQNRISFTVESTNELIKEQKVLIEDLKRGRIIQNDSFTFVQQKHEKHISKKDSILKKEKFIFNEKVKKYKKEKDSLINIINSFKQSDLEPIKKN